MPCGGFYSKQTLTFPHAPHMCTCVGLARTIHIYIYIYIYIYTVYIRYFWQENHQICGHIRFIYAVLANPKFAVLPGFLGLFAGK